MTPETEEMEKQIENFVRKSNNGTVKKILIPTLGSVGLAIAIPLITAGVMYGNLEQAVKSHIELAAHPATDIRMDQLEKDAKALQSDVKHLNKSIDRIEESQEDIKILLNNLLAQAIRGNSDPYNRDLK